MPKRRRISVLQGGGFGGHLIVEPSAASGIAGWINQARKMVELLAAAVQVLADEPGRGGLCSQILRALNGAGEAVP
jgi:hypothetical protein